MNEKEIKCLENKKKVPFSPLFLKKIDKHHFNFQVIFFFLYPFSKSI